MQRVTVLNGVFELVVANQGDHGIWCRMYKAHSNLWRTNYQHAKEVSADWQSLWDHWVDQDVDRELTAQVAADMDLMWSTPGGRRRQHVDPHHPLVCLDWPDFD